MDATIRSKTLNDDAGAALRRAVGFAALFGLAGVASIACTARTPDRASIVATDRLLAEEARLTAQVHHAEAITFPSTLLARRSNPAVAEALASASRHFTADRATAEGHRAALIERIEAARAERDLFESRYTVLRLKNDLAMEHQAEARAAGDRAALAATSAEVASLHQQIAAAGEGAHRAAIRVQQLTRGMAMLAQASEARATQQLEKVQAQLRGG